MGIKWKWHLVSWGVVAAFCQMSLAETVLLSVRDGESLEVTSARVEIMDADGDTYYPESAVPVYKECPRHPFPAWFPDCFHGFSRNPYIYNPFTDTDQFYIHRVTTIELPEGEYRLRAYKGYEYRMAELFFEVREDNDLHLIVTVDRWSDEWRERTQNQWVSADDHLHITRQNHEDDRNIAAIMQAEDIQVGNLIQFGTERFFDGAKQHHFGTQGEYREGNTLLLSGQEHPRTHFLGHTVTLGADQAIDLRDNYIVYQRFFELAQSLNGLAGFAHWALGPAQDGIAISAPGKKVSFIEVLQMEYPHYEVWYEMMNLGLAMAPIAGTDFPCGSDTLPGRERFYTKVEGKLTRQSWLDGIRHHRTFVTNGPVVEFNINQADIGDTVNLKAAGEVTIDGYVYFDPSRDSVQSLELIQNGQAERLYYREVGPGVLWFNQRRWIDRSAWYALRVTGQKLGETPLEDQGFADWQLKIGEKVNGGVAMRDRERFARENSVRPTAAHTAAIYVEVEGLPSQKPENLARQWLMRLEAIEFRLHQENIEEIPILDWMPNSDGVSLENLQANREELLRQIQIARSYYSKFLLTLRH